MSMKTTALVGAVLCVAVSLAADRGDWYREAKLGMFIHWGLYSVGGHGEWAMARDGVPQSEYSKTAKTWNPDVGCEKEWVDAAKAAGLKYIVLTTRHHDGFSLFDSKSKRARGCDYMSTMSPANRDHVRCFADACRAAGVKVGFYYSFCDWSFKESPTADYPKAVLPAMRQQGWDEIRQLMTEYGKIDLLWYDGGYSPPGTTTAGFWDATNLNAMVRSLQPGILINNRAGKSEDFGTLEGQNIIRPPARADLNSLWELCLTLQDDDWSFWGHCKGSFFRKTPEQMACMCLHCLEMGGNFLMNVSPDGKGHLPAWQVDLLKKFGNWVDTHRDGIYGTRATPIATSCNLSNGWTGNSCSFFVRKGDRLYGFMHAWPGEESRYPYFRAKVKSATYRGKPLTFEQDRESHAVVFRGFPKEQPADDWSPMFEVVIEETSVRIADKKNPWADIVIAEAATPSARAAALELKRRLDEATGGEFRVVTDAEPQCHRYRICVGPTRFTRLRTETGKWAWQFAKDQAEFAGAGAETDAVGNFLEKELGICCRGAAAPDEDRPKLRAIDVDYKRVH